MDVKIFDEQRCIRLVVDGSIMIINKQQIRVIDTPNADMVRIDIGEGPLKHIFIRASEVTVPNVFGNAYGLRDILADWWEKDFTGAVTYSNKVDQLGDLDAIKTLLQDIKVLLSNNSNTSNNGNTVPPPAVNPFDQALISDNNVLTGVIYFGYSVMATSVAAAAWAIKKTITTNGNIVTLWANGNQNFSQVWNNRYGLIYTALIAN